MSKLKSTGKKSVAKSAKRAKPAVTGIGGQDLPAPLFPLPGSQDCFADGSATLTVHGNLPTAPIVITGVQLFIGAAVPMTPPTPVPPTDNGDGTWNANFTNATPASLANTPCRLILTGRDGTTRVTLAYEFIHVPPAVSLSMIGTPAANHTTLVSGVATNATALTATVDGSTVSVTFDTTSGAFSFATPSTTSASQSLVFTATHPSGEQATIQISLNVDQTSPTFENGPNPVTSEDDSDLVTGEVNDPDTDLLPASGFDFTATPTNPPLTAALVDSSGSPIAATLALSVSQISAIAFSYEVTITRPVPTAGTLMLLSTDIAGNTVNGVANIPAG